MFICFDIRDWDNIRIAINSGEQLKTFFLPPFIGKGRKERNKKEIFLFLLERASVLYKELVPDRSFASIKTVTFIMPEASITEQENICKIISSLLIYYFVPDVRIRYVSAYELCSDEFNSRSKSVLKFSEIRAAIKGYIYKQGMVGLSGDMAEWDDILQFEYWRIIRAFSEGQKEFVFWGSVLPVLQNFVGNKGTLTKSNKLSYEDFQKVIRNAVEHIHDTDLDIFMELQSDACVKRGCDMLSKEIKITILAPEKSVICHLKSGEIPPQRKFIYSFNFPAAKANLNRIIQITLDDKLLPLGLWQLKKGENYHTNIEFTIDTAKNHLVVEADTIYPCKSLLEEETPCQITYPLS